MNGMLSRQGFAVKRYEGKTFRKVSREGISEFQENREVDFLIWMEAEVGVFRQCFPERKN